MHLPLENDRKRLILVELNEINFDVVKRYIDGAPGRFPALECCMAGVFRETSGEQVYEHLEPWIQWPSVHTGKSFEEHGVFRLGDITSFDVPQIFEEIERAGFSVGVLSAMNAANRLKKAKYFIPDPWTKTEPDNSFWSRSVSAAVSQAVNDNASQKITAGSALRLILALVRFARFKHYGDYLSLALGSRRASWKKALFLDLFLHDLHLSLFKRYKPDFSTVFLNAGAHIQHHYFFNSPYSGKSNLVKNPTWYVSETEDPVADMLSVYDKIIDEILALNNVDVIIATGLSQKPYDRVKFYYRLRDHKKLLEKLGIRFTAVFPRMTRDFLVEFNGPDDAIFAENILKSIQVLSDGKQLFSEIDNRGNSLFVTLTYPHEITEDTRFSADGKEFYLLPEVAFVAIKNGMHQGKGFAYFSRGVEAFSPKNGAHVKELHETIRKYFAFV